MVALMNWRKNQEPGQMKLDKFAFALVRCEGVE